MTSPRVPLFLSYIGANIRRLRRKRGMTQEALAEAAELDLTFIQRIELAKTNLGVAALVTIADALAVPPGTLFRKAALPVVKRGRPRKARGG